MKINIITMAYSHINKSPRVRPQPDVCEFIKAGEIKAFGTRRPEVSLLEDFFRTIRLEYTPILKSFLPQKRTTQLLRDLEHSVLRCAMSKPGGALKVKVPNGVIDKLKLDTFKVAWLWHVQNTCKPSADSRWVHLEDTTKKAIEESVLVPVISDSLVVEAPMDVGKPSPTGDSAGDGPFIAGARVKIAGWRVTGVDQDGSRRDVAVGRMGVIQGVEQEAGRCAVVFEASSSSKGRREITCKVTFDNLEAAGPGGPEPAPADSKAAASKGSVKEKEDKLEDQGKLYISFYI